MNTKNFAYIATLARTLSGTHPDNYTEDEILQDLNIVRQDMYEKVVAKGKSNPFWDEASIDLIRGENEYPLPSGDDELYDGMGSVKKVFVKYQENGNYEELSYSEIQSVLGDGKEDGRKYYTIADNSIFVFPAPQKDVEDGLVVQGNNTLKPITTTATEKQIWANRMPSTAYETLALAVAVRYVKYRKRDWSEAQNLEVEYEKELLKIINNFKARSVRIYDNEPIPMRRDLQ